MMEHFTNEPDLHEENKSIGSNARSFPLVAFVVNIFPSDSDGKHVTCKKKYYNKQMYPILKKYLVN